MAEKQTEKIILTLVIAIVVVVVAAVLSMIAMMGGYFWEGHEMMGPGMMGWDRMGYLKWMPLGGLIFFVILMIGLYLVLSSLKKPGAVSGDAMEILRERYAKGELTSEQYRSMKKELET